MGEELIVAAKEFRDYLMSKRFLMIFAVLILLSIVGMLAGIADYNEELDQYKDRLQQQSSNPAVQQTIADLQKQISDAQDRGAPAGEIDMLKQQLSALTNPSMPSVMHIFRSFNTYFGVVGMILAVSMGFDLISREKEDGSLKSLLTHPVYRDEVINGKALGSIAMLVIVLMATFLVTISIMLISGIVPSGNDLIRIPLYFAASLLYIVAFFAVSLAASVVSKNSGMAILITIGVIAALVLVPMMSESVVAFAMGPEPDMTIDTHDVHGSSAGSGSVNVAAGAFPGNFTVRQSFRINEEYTEYWNKRNQITDMINIVSPINDFEKVSEAMLDTASASGAVTSISGGPGGKVMMIGRSLAKTVTLRESVSSVWANILALTVIAIAAMAVAYVKFMRLDIR